MKVCTLLPAGLEEQAALARLTASVHAQTVLEIVRALPCSVAEKQELLRQIIAASAEAEAAPDD